VIKVYNSLTRKKEEFVTLEENKVKMYACGVTPYDEAHIGHAMQAIIFDTIRRYLEYKKYSVTYVRNFTDVDDKIINRANKENVDPMALSAKFIKETKNDLKNLKVNDATHEPLVSAHIKEIISFISTLIDKGFAYNSNGNVYFDLNTFKKYGKLSGRKIDDLISEGETDKKNPQDFALWKKEKEGEPSWDSPWGKGRPGWHIECSVLAHTYLGESIDIHGGGVDIIFPHHENEITQSEAFSGKTFAKYWLHNGLLMVGKQKMSKSLGNFYTIKEALQNYTPDVIRYMILSFSYNSNVNFEEKNLIDAEKRIYYYYSTLEKLQNIKDSTENPNIVKYAEDFKKEFEESMDDNFNTAKALAGVNDFFTKINKELDAKKISGKDSIKILEALKPIQNIFSILDEKPKKYIIEYQKRVLFRLKITKEELEEKINIRNLARTSKDFKTADNIRNELLEKGILIMDTKEGVSWYYNPSN
jgi:cysteinyl-tRNA synthetase